MILRPAYSTLENQKPCLSGDFKGLNRGNSFPTWGVQPDEVNVHEDQRLIAQTLDGSTSAFGQLVRKYQDRLYHALVHTLGNEHDAQDVAQEAFVQAYCKLNTFQHAARFYTWLYRIAFNLAMNHLRRRRPERFSDHRAGAEGQWERTVAAPPEEDPLERQETCQQVQQALQRLGEDFRAILVLREIEGYSYEEIADILQLPIGTVRSRLHRARCQMREELEKLLQEDIRES